MVKAIAYFLFACYVSSSIEAFEFDSIVKACHKISDSNQAYVLAVPEQLHKYVICRKYSHLILNCPDGMPFNSIYKVCLLPELRYHQTIGNIVSAYAGGIRHPGCPLKDPKEPILLPHTSDCNKFFICSAGIGHEKVCPKGLHFNVDLKVCDYPEKAGCDSSSAISQLKRNNVLQQCPNENTPTAKLLPHESQCGLYYICESGSGVLRNCPEGLHFNPKITVCDYPENVECDYTIPILETSSTKQAFSVYQTNATISRTTKEEASSIAYYTSETSIIAKETTTSAYDTKKTTNRMTNEVTGFPSPFCPKVNGKYPFFFRHTEDCSIYYMCGNGLAYEFSCPSGLHFNLVLNVCDHPENAGCLRGQKRDKQ